jgi:polygalacturonase
VVIDGITVNSVVNRNNDGIDIDSCHRVRISNCDIISGDDAIVLKSTSDRICKDITITNCILSSHCNAIKCGTESNGGFQNITVDNCTIYDTRLAGIALELVDGGIFDRVSISNITMNNVEGGIFVRLGNRARPFTSEGPGGSRGTFTMKPGTVRPGMGSMSNIVISNIQASGVGITGCSITGLPNYPVENITLDNIRIRYKGGGTVEDAAVKVPEKPEAYPEYKMFGLLPAYGFFVRHARNVRFTDIDLSFEQTEQRPAFIFDSVSDLRLSDIRADCSKKTPALLHCKQVKGAVIQDCRPDDCGGPFMRISGEQSQDIMVSNNDLSRVSGTAALDDNVPENAVYLTGNRSE